MFKLIAVVEKSKIIREGLESLLRSQEITKRIVCMESFDEWNTVLKNISPDVVIVNPDLTREGLDKLKSRYHLEKHTLFVAILYLYYSYKEINEMFDEMVYITDPEDTILNKFQNLHDKIEKTSDDNSNEQLSSREKDVLRLLLQGFSNKEVAEKLFISMHTVISHRKNIIEKTGIRSLSGLAVYAILNNIADMDDLKQ